MSYLGIKFRRVVLAGAMLLMAMPVAFAQSAAPGERPPQAVTVVTLAEQDITLTATLPGRIVASALAEVRPQVNGIIIRRTFEEGANVALGDPMYRIDPDSYEARVAAARAQVAQAEAKYTASRKEAERAAELIGRGVSTEQRLENAAAVRDADAAALKVAKADLQSAEIDLKRTTIRAPLAGVVGRSLTTQGALVTAGQATPLAVIRTLDPVHVDVTQSAAELLEWRRGRTREKLGDGSTEVTLILADGEVFPHTGEMTAAEPHVDELTGVVTLRMEFANPEHLLLPGMYVQVKMPQRVLKNVVLAPQQGVSRDRRGRPIAFVANADDVVEQRELTIAQAQGSHWVITDGLKAGDRLIIEGLQKIGPQMKVAPEERKPPETTATTAPSSN
ncbi:efflux RND transporter periplasmic adaptor subunit [Oceanibacterium hippocampi]|uniref:Putative efflux pump periplasmic linker TtgA n=1 Tax=Oceanibacterium hippocampi TaxID=745714 RepID=A0A1Y5U0I8_9PROT|nr:efflux RND transporter periplasmic adaptor subunit [Oceanibacterium hippocampi]SLN75606.1 putative efflux pump periplasmic linker TtgA precursor [Oceanibacterium hippocampi]